MGPISLISPIGAVGVEGPEGAGSPVSGVWSPYGTEDGGSGATGRVEPTG